MGQTTFSGPVKAGTIKETSGTTIGNDVANVGWAVMSQSAPISQATNGFTNIVIPADSQILYMDIFATAAWTGAASTLNVGTTAAATELAVAADNTVGAIGRIAITPGANAARVNKWIDVGPKDVGVFINSTNTGTGAGVLTVRYAQSRNNIVD